MSPRQRQVLALPRRRQVLVLAASPALLGACTPQAPARFATVDAAVQALQQLSPEARTRAGWGLPQVLVHAAQSIEYSLSGFPQAKPAWFQASVGRAAFAFFDARGRMSHSLTEPIPGAPALPPEATLAAARDRLLQALAAFRAHEGPLHPHFAYGALDKAAYTRAHLMHLDDHWSEVDTTRTTA